MTHAIFCMGGKVGRLHLRGSAENWARMNDFQAKSAFIIKRYAIVLETQCLTSHVKSLNYEYLCKVSSHIIECFWMVSLCMGTCGRRFLRAFSSNGLFFFRRNRRMSRIVLPASATSEFSAKCSTLSGRTLAGFSAVIARVALSNLTEMAMRSWLQSLLLRFVNGDRRDFDFVGIPYRGSIGCNGRDLYTNWWYCSFRFATQVLNFPTNCSSCNAPAETRMKVVGILPASFSCWVLTVNIITYSRSCCLSHVTRVLFSFDFIFATPLLSGSLIQASLQAVRLYISMCIVLFLSLIKHVKSCAL